MIRLLGRLWRWAGFPTVGENNDPPERTSGGATYGALREGEWTATHTGPLTWRTEHIADPATGLTLCKQQTFDPVPSSTDGEVDCVQICPDCATAARLLT